VKETALTLPFTFNSLGNVSTTTEQTKIWADRVRAVIGTNLRERLMHPDFGTLIPSTFMETQSVASSTVETEVNLAFAKQLPSLDLLSVDSSFDDYTGSLNIEISYALPNNTVVNTIVSILHLIGDAPAYEENV
jgi:hypothetical protein